MPIEDKPVGYIAFLWKDQVVGKFIELGGKAYGDHDELGEAWEECNNAAKRGLQTSCEAVFLDGDGDEVMHVDVPSSFVEAKLIETLPTLIMGGELRDIAERYHTGFILPHARKPAVSSNQ